VGFTFLPLFIGRVRWWREDHCKTIGVTAGVPVEDDRKILVLVTKVVCSIDKPTEFDYDILVNNRNCDHYSMVTAQYDCFASFAKRKLV